MHLMEPIALKILSVVSIYTLTGRMRMPTALKTLSVVSIDTYRASDGSRSVEDIESFECGK